MSRYIIHACPQRMDYVDKYLIPSMKSQGISNIDLRCDDCDIGNLSKCMEIFESMRGDGGSWHLQDDIVICRNFKSITEQYDDGKTVICGFVWDLDENVNYTGYVSPEHMWTFPCVYIPNRLARECADWFYSSARDNPKYKLWAMEGRYDDFFFQEFLINKYPNDKVLNLKPNLVDHVDYLIGGTLVDKWRKHEQVRSAYFEDLDLVNALEKEFNYKGE